MLRNLLAIIALAGAGLFVAIVGTAAHRYEPYWGIVLAILLVLVSALFARAWRGWMGLSIFSSAWTALLLFLTYVDGPGGNIVVLEDGLGFAWYLGGAAAVIAIAFVPRRFVSENTDVS